MLGSIVGFLFPYPLTVEQARSVPHSQYSYRWVALLPNLVRFGFPLRVQVPPTFPVPLAEESTLPFLSPTRSEIHEGSQYYGYSNDFKIGEDLRLRLYLDQYGLTLSYISAWKSMVRNKDRTFNYPMEYKYDILILLTLNYQIPYVGIKLKGAFPTESSVDPSLSYEKSERLTLNQTFSVDDIEIFNPTNVLKGGILETMQKIFNIPPTTEVSGAGSVSP